jgi:hypothetical protein
VVYDLLEMIVRQETMKMRRELNRMAMLEPLPNDVS